MVRTLSIGLAFFTVVACNRATSESSSAQSPAPGVAPAASANVSAAGSSEPSGAPVVASDAAPTNFAPRVGCGASSALLAVGCEVPDVAAPAQDGKTVRLRELKGKPLVVYFYPKDDTAGCTVEAKGIRDQYAELNRLAVVLGVSTDDSESHKAFADKYDLPFRLLDDSSHALVTAFGVPLVFGHAHRVTFVIDGAGKVRKVFPNVNPDGHATELIETLKTL